ncbi:MAG: hypothetical protein AAB074_09575 [Planctomycetota bacterium]
MGISMANGALPLFHDAVRADRLVVVGLKMAELGNQGLREDVLGFPLVAKRLFTAMGIEHTSIDINGKDGALPIDLGIPISQPELLGAFDLLTNFGTVEHVNRQYQAWLNIHRLVKVGGLFLHILPETGSWPGYCEYRYGADFFPALAACCGYEIVKSHRCGIEADRKCFAAVLRKKGSEFPNEAEFLARVPIDASAASKGGPLTVRRLLEMSRADLDELYASRGAGSIPQGDSRGTGIPMAGSFLTAPISRLGNFLWQGKVFDPATSTLVNKVLGIRLFVARVYPGESWFDGKPAIIVDYQGTSWLCGPIRDEIRELAPGLYLGMAYLRSAGRKRLLHFALDLTPAETPPRFTRRVTGVLSALLILSGILGLALPHPMRFTSTAPPFLIFHIAAGLLGSLIAVFGRNGHTRAFNFLFGLACLYQAVASFAVLFPAKEFLWKRFDDVLHLALGLALVAVGLLGGGVLKRRMKEMKRRRSGS